MKKRCKWVRVLAKNVWAWNILLPALGLSLLVLHLKLSLPWLICLCLHKKCLISRHYLPQPQPSQLENLPLSHQAESPTRSDLGLQPIDFNSSPYLRDLEMNPECEFQSIQVTYQSSVSGPGRQSRHLMQHTRHVSPRQSHSIFAGCTIHNVTVNVHPQS